MHRCNGKEAATLEDKPSINIYLQSSIKAPQRKDGAYAYVLEYFTAKGPVTKNNTKTIENATKNLAVLNALEEALHRVNKPCHITIYTDNSHVAAAIENGWIKKWMGAGWKNAKGQAIANQEKWRAVEYLLSIHDFDIALNCHHEYKEWLIRETARKEKENV